MALDLIRGGRRDELPTAWDGRRVDWGPAMAVRAVSHVGAIPCNGCGSTSAPMDAHIGRVHPAPGATVRETRTKRTRSGREYGITRDVPAQPEARLSLNRCLACGHDSVLDLTTNQLWDLDYSDYEPDGSWPSQPELPIEGDH